MLEYLANPEGSLWKEQELRNPGEVTRMLFALSGDRRYLEYVPFMETGGCIFRLNSALFPEIQST